MSTSGSNSPTQTNGKAYGLLFAVEKYLEKGLDSVLYAERDATEVAKALAALGYDAADIAIFINENATKTTIEYETSQLAKTAKKGDTVFFFFAGHGYTYGGKNFLLAYDSRRGDIVKTAVSLHDIFELFAESECRQVMCFLDCCHTGWEDRCSSVSFPAGWKS